MGFFERLKEGLSKTRRNFTDRIQELVGLSAAIDDDFLDELEMILLSADVGVKTTEKLIDAVRKAAKKKEISGTEDVIPFLKKYQWGVKKYSFVFLMLMTRMKQYIYLT